MVQGTLKSLLNHCSSRASILWHSAFFIVQLSHPHMTTGKTIALTRWTFVGKVMSLLFKMLSSLVKTFLSRSKHLLVSWLQSPSAVILEPKIYAEYIMRNARLDEAQALIKIAGGNINNLRYADDTTPMAESEEEPNSLLMKMKEESGKVGLKLNIQKTKIVASGLITSWQIHGETVSDYFSGLQNHCRW